MPKSHVIYPFEPRTSRDLAPGHYWAVPLHDGRYAAGVMLAHVLANEKLDRTKIVVGLLDWVSPCLPSCDDLTGAKICRRAFVHIRAIESCGSMVIGRLERDWGAAVLDIKNAGSTVAAWGLLGMQYNAEMRWGDARLMAARLKAEVRSKNAKR